MMTYSLLLLGFQMELEIIAFSTEIRGTKAFLNFCSVSQKAPNDQQTSFKCPICFQKKIQGLNAKPERLNPAWGQFPLQQVPEGGEGRRSASGDPSALRPLQGTYCYRNTNPEKAKSQVKRYTK